MPVALRSATFAVAAVALLGTAATGRAQEPIRIGVLQPMTGPATKNGTENYTAMQIARDMINERGGVNGRKVDFLLADIPTPTAAISETERLTTKDGVKITLGSGVSLLAVPVSQAAERHGVFHWETAGAADIITKRGFKYTFQVGPAAYRYGQAAVDLTLGELAKRLGKSPADLRIALLWENRAFGKSVGDYPRLRQGKERQSGLRRRLRPVPHRHDADCPAAEGREAGRADRDLFPQRCDPVSAQGQGARLQRRRPGGGERRLFQP